MAVYKCNQQSALFAALQSRNKEVRIVLKLFQGPLNPTVAARKLGKGVTVKWPDPKVIKLLQAAAECSSALAMEQMSQAKTWRRPNRNTLEFKHTMMMYKQRASMRAKVSITTACKNTQ